ncbi:MAG: response regulator transcription factor [Candidatus Eremiobacteraeota bacterium]|nr:response regulator transcription factor [Candidatus Eremiobacteraeota bacterium]
MDTVSILIADDHAVVRRGLRALVETQPKWKVVSEVATGREAVLMAKRLRPDVAILDISMPELNGLDAASQILKVAPLTRVLILTMHTAEELIQRTLRAGAGAYILKSDAEKDLITAIEALLHKKTFFTHAASEVVLSSLRDPGVKKILPAEGSRLSGREREIVQLLAEGKSNKQVAGMLNISTRTVENHRAKVMEKLKLHSFSELVRYAVRNKIAEL